MSIYIYGVVDAKERLNLGPIGMGEKSVYTIEVGTLAFVVSEADREEYIADSICLGEHERVLETVMKSRAILPMRFGTVAASEKEIILMLKRHQLSFRKALMKLNGKVEVEIEVLWMDMKGVFDEIVNANPKLKMLRSNGAPKRREDVIMAGQMVFQLLQEKKRRETDAIVKPLKRHAVEYVPSPSATDDTIMKGSFLIDKARLPEFDRALDAVDAKLGGRMRIKYFGPMPPYSFANMRIR